MLLLDLEAVGQRCLRLRITSYMGCRYVRSSVCALHQECQFVQVSLVGVVLNEGGSATGIRSDTANEDDREGSQ